MISPQPNLITRRAGRLLLVWTLTIDLSGMGGPTRRTKSPASIALRFTETHKPVHHDKVAVSTEQENYLYDELIFVLCIVSFVYTHANYSC